MPHNDAHCPEFRRQWAAEAKATAICNGAKPIVKDRRGHDGLPDLDPQTDFATFKALMSAGEISAVERDTIFDNKLQAEKYRQVLLEPLEEQDPTIPQSEAEQKAHVVMIIKAFRHVSDEGGAAKVKEDFQGCRHDRWLVECLAWDILDLLIRRSESVGNLVETYEPGKYKFKKCQDMDFADRFELLVSAMATNKSMCKHLYDVPYIMKVIDDPRTNVDRIESNRRLNRQKAEIMKKGKAAAAEDGDQNKRGKKRTLDQAGDTTKTVTKKRKAASTTPVNNTGSQLSMAHPPFSAPSVTPLATQAHGRLQAQFIPAMHNPTTYSQTAMRQAFNQPMPSTRPQNFVPASPHTPNNSNGMHLGMSPNQFLVPSSLMGHSPSHPYGQLNVSNGNFVQTGLSSNTMSPPNGRIHSVVDRPYEDEDDDQTAGGTLFQTQQEQIVGRQQSVHSAASTVSSIHAGAPAHNFLASPYGGAGYPHQARPTPEDFQAIGAMNQGFSDYPDPEDIHHGMPSQYLLGLDPSGTGHDGGGDDYDAPCELEE